MVTSGNSVSNENQTLLKDKVTRPSMYQVILLNDDYTPMEFVVEVLMKYFSKNIDEANQVMLHVHKSGMGLCGVYPFDIAETKVMQVMNFSIKNGHPLQCKMEKNR
ncbi:MAG: ATP-dependent Clp protease adapter ClpS [Hyphomicrobiales bacterium]|jgi:ATP-dependent Clp protease adaptor protein ClpS|nr:ATP-dependent Clp protease adapter ClpS [Hyphomicrobiales bacterium]|tara:strand:- start:205 stop:522 length:318 start_codon:yes stop_codon:yes gene_type:complete